MSTFNTSEKDISELEDRQETEITQTEAQREKRVKQKQNRASMHQDSTRQYNICLVGISEGKERIWEKKYLKKNNGQEFSKINTHQTADRKLGE